MTGTLFDILEKVCNDYNMLSMFAQKRMSVHKEDALRLLHRASAVATTDADIARA
jgi:hypothetical protein